MPLSHLEWQTAHPTNRCWACANGAGVTTIYAYDDFGRRTSESSSAGETDYTWDSLGRLKGIASEDATSTYEYGPTGMRERAVVESANTTTTTECVWSGGTLVASRVSETQGGTTTVTDYRYLYGPDSLPLEMIVTPEGGTPSAYTFQCDRAGSVIALTDATGAAVATYTYDPWGALVEAPTTGVGARNPLRYRGYYLDDATGLYCLPARYYDPEVARFLSPDPAAPSAGDPLSLNRYAYCVGDPVNADDPSGATIDMDGDGGLDVEDTWTQSWLYTDDTTPVGSARKAARRTAVEQAAVCASVTFADGIKAPSPESPGTVSKAALWAFRNAVRGTAADYIWQDATRYDCHRVCVGPVVLGWNVGVKVVNGVDQDSYLHTLAFGGQWSAVPFGYSCTPVWSPPETGLGEERASFQNGPVGFNTNGEPSSGTPNGSAPGMSYTWSPYY